MKELLTPDGEHHAIGNGDGLVMTKNEDPPLWSPKQIPDLPSRGSGVHKETKGY